MDFRIPQLFLIRKITDGAEPALQLVHRPWSSLLFMQADGWTTGKVRNPFCFRSVHVYPNSLLSNLILFLLLQFSSNLIFPVITMLVSSTNFIRPFLLLVPSSILKMWNNIGLETDPWGAPAINSFQTNLPFLTHATCVSLTHTEFSARVLIPLTYSVPVLPTVMFGYRLNLCYDDKTPASAPSLCIRDLNVISHIRVSNRPGRLLSSLCSSQLLVVAEISI